MWRKLDKSGLLAVVSGILLVVVVVAALLLYRWVGRVNDADRAQQKELLEVAVHGFQSDFAGIVQEIHVTFRPPAGVQEQTDLEAHLAEMLAQWQNNSRQPQLIGGLSAGLINYPTGAFTFLRFNPEKKQLEKQEWPVGLESYRDIRKERSLHRPISQALTGLNLVMAADQAIIVIPVPSFRSRGPDGGRDWMRRQRSFAGEAPRQEGPFQRMGPPPARPFSQPGERIPEDRFPPLMGWCFVSVDIPFLRHQLLPSLAERHFGRAHLSHYQLAVVGGAPRQIIYSAEEGLSLESLQTVDMAAPLLRFPTRWGPPFRPRDGSMPPPDPRGDRRPEATVFFERPNQGPPSELNHGSWQLLVRHKSGSLDIELRKARYRNLAIGFGILSLMAGSIVTLLLSTRRAMALAKQQMEFVAGVSHELRTPLSVIQSAGFNLARGLTLQSERVQQYGAVIQSESRRLSEMIEKILSYAGIQSGSDHYQFQAVNVGPLVQALLEEYRETFEEAGWTVEQQIAEDIPMISADEKTLKSALRNLLDNALKYASSGKWLRVKAATDQSEVVITVEDRGPGIEPADLPRIFEPFYRGRTVLASSTPGAGLGLSLLQRYLKAHGGRVQATNLTGGGASFALYLPARKLEQAGSP